MRSGAHRLRLVESRHNGVVGVIAITIVFCFFLTLCGFDFFLRRLDLDLGRLPFEREPAGFGPGKDSVLVAKDNSLHMGFGLCLQHKPFHWRVVIASLGIFGGTSKWWRNDQICIPCLQLPTERIHS